MPKWFRIILGVTLLGVVLGFLGVVFSEDMGDVVEGQLSKIRENRITQAYYDYTAKEFQKTTSLEAFREFLSLYPILSDSKTFTIDEQDTSDDRGSVKGLLISNDQQQMKVEYQLIKEDDKWKILSMRLEELISEGDLDAVTLELVDRVDRQLKAFREEDVDEAYYEFLSEDFKKETPFQVFKEFVRAHPVLTNFKGVNFKERRIENNKGHVVLVLNADSGDYLLEYKLMREGGEWKVWSLRLVLPPEEAAKQVATNPEALTPPVRELLDALLLDNIREAYNGTAGEFQEATPYGTFEDFVSSYPILTERDLADVQSALIENGIGKLRINLHDDEEISVFEFKLGFDEGKWKVWGIQIVNQPEAYSEDSSMGPVSDRDPSLLADMISVNDQKYFVKYDFSEEKGDGDFIDSTFQDGEGQEEMPAEAFEFEKIEIGTEIDDDGIITNPTTVINSDVYSIFINVYINNGVEKTAVSLSLEHVESLSTAPPLSTSLGGDGDVVISFSYDAPTRGWPEGEYSLTITASSGEEMNQKFQVHRGESSESVQE